MQMFDHDRSASRGEMSARGLFIFKHDNTLGNAPASALLERIQVSSNSEVPRSIKDYQLVIDDTELPQGVELIKKLSW